jgi:hypothetical protein
VVLDEPLHVMAQGVQRGRREDAVLAHRTTHAGAMSAGGGNQ